MLSLFGLYRTLKPQESLHSLYFLDLHLFFLYSKSLIYRGIIITGKRVVSKTGGFITAVKFGLEMFQLKNVLIMIS